MPEKKKWASDPVDRIYSPELRLPSFGISVTRSEPRAEVGPAGRHIENMTLDSGDAFSVSYFFKGGKAVTADRDFLPLDESYLRRILIQVLDREEYRDIVAHYEGRWEEVESVSESPEGWTTFLPDQRLIGEPRAQVRITDLRLAKDIQKLPLKRELEEVLDSLQLPVTTDSVTRWKYQVLKENKSRHELKALDRALERNQIRRAEKRLRVTLEEAMNKDGKKYKQKLWQIIEPAADDLTEEEEKQHEQERSEIEKREHTRIKAVSFAAAALLLLHDLDMRDLQEADRSKLQKSIVALREIVANPTTVLDNSVNELSKLVSNRSPKGGQLKDPDIKAYAALFLYRMGYSPEAIAPWVDIKGHRDQYGKWRGPKNWRTVVKTWIEKGLEIEKKRFPRSADMLSHPGDESVRAKAIKAYRDHREVYEFYGEPHILQYISEYHEVYEVLPILVNEERELDLAYIQLGSCLIHKIHPINITLTFR